MDLKDLQYMLVIARYHSINRAAKELYLSQPYLSSKLKSLEKELGIQIFHRKSSGILPTSLGKTFLSSAAKICAEVDHILTLKDQSLPLLNVVSYYGPFFFNCYLQFQKEYPSEGRESFKEMSLKECLRSLNNGTAQLALVCHASDSHDYYEKLAQSYHCILRELFPHVPLSVIMRKEHPLSRRTSITPEAMSSYPLVCYNDSLPFFQHIGFSEKQDILSVSDRGSMFDSVENSDSLGVIAVLGEEPVKQEIAYVPLEAEQSTLDFVYATSADYQLNTRERSFLNFIRQSFRNG